jgi:hypothetical protein
VENLPTLFKFLGYESFSESIEALVKGFLKDHYYAVREQTFLIFGKMKEAFGAEKTKTLIVGALTELSKETNFVFRVASLQGLAKCGNALEKKDLSDTFIEFGKILPYLAKRMESDKVPNVLINLSKCYISLKNQLTPQAKKDWQPIAKKLKENKDEDVVFFATKSEE